MSRFFSLACAVSLSFCCVFVAKHSHAGALLSAKHAVSKIISASKASQLGHRILTTTMVVAACANLLSCGDLEQEAYQHLNTNELKDPPITNELKGLPIMQGATTASQTQVFVLTAKRDNHVYSLLDGVGNEIAPALLDRDEYPGNEYVMQHMFFRGLTPDSEYLFRVHSFTGELLDERELRTLDPSRQAVRFAFGSCMSDYVPQGDIWQQMVALKPDVIFLIGDNVYTNNFSPITPPDFMWIRYVSTRRFLNLFKDRQLVPVVAVWDDHDYGMSNGDLIYPHKEEALSIFTAFFASYETDNFYMPNIGAASFFSIYGYNFFFSCGQYFHQQDKLRFTVVDLGIGIGGAINKHLGINITPEQAISSVVKGGITTKINSHNIMGGSGLSLLREFAMSNKGGVYIMSGNGYWQLTNGEEKAKQLNHTFHGTVISLTINTQQGTTNVQQQ